MENHKTPKKKQQKGGLESERFSKTILVLKCKCCFIGGGNNTYVVRLYLYLKGGKQNTFYFCFYF